MSGRLPLPLAHAHPTWEDFGVLEWSIAAVAGLFVMWSIWKAVQLTLSPGEEGADHPKRIIFDPPAAEGPVSSDPPPEGGEPPAPGP